jgi:soluble lytic murein transglycosylase-like protein
MAEILPTSTAPPTDLDRLRNSNPTTIEAEKARLRKTTKEFESFFLYYMLKTMRETLTSDATAQETPLGGSMGKDTYQQMFDMEISRQMVRGGNRSLSEMLYKSMEKLVEARYEATERAGLENASGPQATSVTRSKPIELHPNRKPVAIDNSLQFKAVKQTGKPDFAPITSRRAIKVSDPIKSRFGKIITQAAEETNLKPALIHSVIKAESNGDPYAVSDAGAKGLMQLADSTARDLGVRNPFDPKANVMGGAKYLRTLIDKYKGNLRLALAAYNAGPGTVERHGGVPPFKETHDYIQRVTTYLRNSAQQFDEP